MSLSIQDYEYVPENCQKSDNKMLREVGDGVFKETGNCDLVLGNYAITCLSSDRRRLVMSSRPPTNERTTSADS